MFTKLFHITSFLCYAETSRDEILCIYVDKTRGVKEIDALVFGGENFKGGFYERKERWKECKIEGKMD
jgi:hypothetical protein